MSSALITPIHFPTILCARGNDCRPSDLEVCLRSHCNRVKVVEDLSGAHLKFPSIKGLSVRAYFSYDVDGDSSNSWTAANKQTQRQQRCPNISGDDNNADHDEDDFDHVAKFFRNFEFTVVFFILSEPRQQKDQLDDPNSLFHRVQRVAHKISLESGDDQSTKDKVARVSLVKSPECAIKSIASLAGTIQNWDSKKSYYERKREELYLPNQSTSTIPINCSPSASRNVAIGIQQLAARLEMPSGEENILMENLRTLGTIADVDGKDLGSIPIESRSKNMLQSFFGSHNNSNNNPSSQKDSMVRDSSNVENIANPLKDNAINPPSGFGAVSSSTYPTPQQEDPNPYPYQQPASSRQFHESNPAFHQSGQYAPTSSFLVHPTLTHATQRQVDSNHPLSNIAPPPYSSLPRQPQGDANPSSGGRGIMGGLHHPILHPSMQQQQQQQTQQQLFLHQPYV